MERLPPLCLVCIAEHLFDSYGFPEPMLAVAREAGNCARVSRWFRESLTLPLYESISMQLEGKPAELPSGLGCTIRQPVRKFLMAEAKEPYATVTATEALGMGIAPCMLERLNYELEMGPPDELDKPFNDEDDAWINAARNWSTYCSNWTPVRKYHKRDVLEKLMFSE